MTRSCSNHCSSCHSCFCSLQAFDAHRSGPWDGERVCWAEENESAAPLRIATEDGICDAYADWQGKGREVGRRLWEHGPAADRARARGKVLRAVKQDTPNVKQMVVREAA